MGPLSMSSLRVKTLVRPFELGDGGALRRDPLGGVVVAIRYLLVGSLDSWREVSRSLCGVVVSCGYRSPPSLRSPQAGSALHAPKREGRRTSLVVAWRVFCYGVRWFSKGPGCVILVGVLGCFLLEVVFPVFLLDFEFVAISLLAHMSFLF